jgi:hypothetical protein
LVPHLAPFYQAKMMPHHFQYCSQDSIQSYSSHASTVSADENEDEKSRRVDVAKRQKCNGNASSSLVIIDNSQDISVIYTVAFTLISFH